MEDWQGPDGEVMVSACIITTAPNARMADLHDRMPVILPPSAWDLWLDPASALPSVRAGTSYKIGSADFSAFVAKQVADWQPAIKAADLK